MTEALNKSNLLLWREKAYGQTRKHHKQKKTPLNCYSRHWKSLNTINKRVTCGSFTKHEENVLVGTERRYKYDLRKHMVRNDTH